MNTKYETSRLTLKINSTEAAAAVCEFYNRNFSEFALYETLTDAAKTISYHKKNLQYEHELYLRNRFIRYYIYEKHNPFTIIGTVSFRNISYDNTPSCVIGYKMDKAKRRQGFCQEAIEFLGNKMFKENKIHRIEATVKTDNSPSMKLLEKIGYKNEGLFKEKLRIGNEYYNHFLYSLQKNDLTIF